MRKLAALVLALSFLLPTMALAQFNPADSGLDTTAGAAFGQDAVSGTNSNLANFIGFYIIGPVLGIMGLLFLVLTVYAGFLWMTSAGDAARVKHAKDILIASVTGAIIMATAYVVTNAVINALSGSAAT